MNATPHRVHHVRRGLTAADVGTLPSSSPRTPPGAPFIAYFAIGGRSTNPLSHHLRTAAALLSLVFAISVRAQSPAPLPQIVFDYTRPGLPTPKFTLTLSADGTGTYTGQEVPTPSRYSNLPSAPRPFERPVTLSEATAKKIFDLAAATPFSDSLCASKAKNIADTGTKIIAYTSSGERRSCTYNYTEQKDVAALTTFFLNLAETMDEGRRLEFMHRFDRLALDAELTSFTRELDEGQAIEPGTIATTLHSLADDSALLQRVRMHAAALLAKIPPTP